MAEVWVRELAFEAPLLLFSLVAGRGNALIEMALPVVILGFIARVALFSFFAIPPWTSFEWTGFWMAFNVIVLTLALRNIGKARLLKRYESAKAFCNRVGVVLEGILKDFNESQFEDE